MTRIRRFLLASGLAASLGLGAPTEARVVKFEVLKVDSPAFEGESFGDVGPYEKITARATMAVDPLDPRNLGIVDLGLARRNAEGRVEFSADVVILRPVDPARANGRLFYDVLNRGNKLGLVLMNDAPAGNNPTKAADAGNGFLMRQGYTVVWSGWQWDVPPGQDRMLFSVPRLSGLTGTSREEFIFENTTNPAVATLTYPAAAAPSATLTVRQREGDPRQTPPGLAFRFVDPTKVEIARPAGFDAGAIYELIYQAADPVVSGLGFAATRDIVSFLRRETADAGGNANPLAPGGRPSIRYALALGISQSGRFLRDLLYQGFNEDEAGRPVFDGLMPHIAGSRKTYTNYRFAQPGRYSRQHEDHTYPGDQFPFAYGISTDRLTGRTDGVLAHCLYARNCPRIIQTDTDTEVWQARVSLVATDPTGNHLAMPENVRAFLLAGVPHFSPANAQPGPTPTCAAPSNPLHAGPAMRALLVALDSWVATGIAPPTSRYPSRDAGTLVPAEPAMAGLPAIPGLAYAGLFNRLQVVDQATVPPTLGAEYPVLVAKPDADGHAVAALRLPPVEAPVATYFGFNLRREGFAAGQLCGLTGSTWPLKATKAEREAAGDPRRSLAERYPTQADYVGAVTRAANALVEARLILPEDAKRYIDRAAATKLAGN